MSDHHAAPHEPEINIFVQITATIAMFGFLLVGALALAEERVTLGIIMLAFSLIAAIGNGWGLFTRKATSPGPLLCGVLFPIIIAGLLAGYVWPENSGYKRYGEISIVLSCLLVSVHIGVLYWSWSSLHPAKGKADDHAHGAHH